MKNKSKLLNKERGITLVALVVTIVVLLILAGISLALVLNNNGIISRAGDAKEKHEQGKTNDQNDLDAAEEWMEKYASGNGSGGGSSEPLPSEDGETLPYWPGDDFTQVEGTDLSNGLTVQDKDGNEYVWVEVPKSLYSKTEYNSNGTQEPKSNEETDKIEYCLKQYTKDYNETNSYSDSYAEDDATGWFKDEAAYNAQKNKMLKSVYDNGGFWVARYEAGLTTPRSTDVTPTATPLSKVDLYPYAYVTRTQAKVLAEKVKYKNCNGSLMFGVQWDLMLAFLHNKGNISNEQLIENGLDLGNYENSGFIVNRGEISSSVELTDQYGKAYGVTWKKYTELPKDENNNYEKQEYVSILLTTGAVESHKQMNIYDVAGNVSEWTLEKGSEDYPCISKGGMLYDMLDTVHGGSLGPRFYRKTKTTEIYFDVHGVSGFRVCLY